MQLKERENRLQVMQEEIDGLQHKIRETKEETAEKDGQIKVLSMNLNSYDKQRSHLSNEIEKYEEAIGQYKINTDKLQQQYRDCHCELIQAEQLVSFVQKINFISI